MVAPFQDRLAALFTVGEILGWSPHWRPRPPLRWWALGCVEPGSAHGMRPGGGLLAGSAVGMLSHAPAIAVGRIQAHGWRGGISAGGAEGAIYGAALASALGAGMPFPVACRWAHDATAEAAPAWGAAVAHLRGWTVWDVRRARRMHIGEVDGACCHLAGLWAVIAAAGPAQVPDRLYDLGADAAVLDAAVWASALAWGLAGLRALGYAAHGRAARRIARRVRICRLRGDLGMSP